MGSPNNPELDPSTTTLAHVAEDAGYRTGLFGKWHLGQGVTPSDWSSGESWSDHYDEMIEADFGTAILGWNTFYGTVASIGDAGYYDWTEIKSVYRWDSHVMPLEQTEYATQVTTDRALQWINNRSGNWLAVVNYHAPHEPLEAPPAGCGYTEDTSSDLATYQAMTECLDMEIGVLLDGIPDLDETVIFFVGDNGTHASVAEDLFDDGRGKGTVYENGVRVPLLVTDGADWLEATTGVMATGPSLVATPGTVISDPVQVLDLFATVAEITGGDGSSGVDSVSLAGATRHGRIATPRPVYTEQFRTETGAAAIRVGDWKLVVNASPVMGCRNSYELYNLAVDRFETTDLASIEVTTLAVLKTQLDSLLATGDSPWLDLPDCS